MKIYAAIAIGGAFGALLRYWLILISTHFFTRSFPWGTWLVNIIGCFFIGFLSSLFLSRHGFLLMWRAFFITGLLGAFTTFSTFTYENMLLFMTGKYLMASINILSSLIIGLIVCFLGVQLGTCLNS
ncbi:MAG: fluoride efflux transporter CrcB [Legionellales bacterium]|nr:fluoride efflux transporter CrcB [Legionellales bacterium]|tara:strand:- start:378 stop:758 length:381 start_codon:yes stop_codon:yes gene_type:complete